MISTQLIIAAVCGVLALLLSVRLLLRRWRRRRTARHEQQAAYEAALRAMTPDPQDVPAETSREIPDAVRAAAVPPADPEPAFRPTALSGETAPGISIIQADRYQAWSPPAVTAWQAPPAAGHVTTWDGTKLFHAQDDSFTAPDSIPKIGPDQIPALETSDFAFGPVTPVLSALMPLSDEVRLLKELRQGGFYQPHALQNLQATRFLLILGTLLLLSLLLLAVPKQAEIPVLLAMLGVPLFLWAVPRLYVQSRAVDRRTQLERAMPDMLDMLNMCVSQGITIPGAMRRIARDLKPIYPVLATELAIVVRQAEVGTLNVALNNFAERVDVPEVDSFVALMNQADRMGTNVSDALTEYSNTMRESLRQRTDEKANKASFKLMFPTVLFMMPAVFMFLMGPAILELQTFFDRGGLEQLQQNTDVTTIRSVLDTQLTQ